MKRYDIKFRAYSVTDRMIRINLRNFFLRKSLFNSEYILVTAKVVQDNKNYYLVQRTLINLRGKQEIKTFTKNILESLVLQNIDLDANSVLTIYYIDSDLSSYNNYKANLSNLGKRFYTAASSLGKRFYSNTTFTGKDYGIKTIILKSSLQEHNLRTYLFSFFRNTKFNSRFIYVLVKISFQYILGIKTLGYKTIINLDNQDEILNYINSVCKYFNEHNEGYYPETGDAILINYIDTTETIYKRNLRNRKLNKYIIKDIPNEYNIPWDNFYSSWGDYEIIDLNNAKITNILFNEKIAYITLKRFSYNIMEITLNFKDSSSFIFKDINLKDEADNYKRLYKDGAYVLFGNFVPYFYFNPNICPPKYAKDKQGNITNKRLDILQPINPVTKIEDNFITLDIETFFDSEDKIKILSLSFYDGKEFNSFYKSDFKDDKVMLDTVFNNLLTKNNNNKYIYIHNGARFDLIFLVKYLLDRKDISLEPLYKDGLFLSITINYKRDIKGKFKYSMTLRDSFLLLPSSLANLGKSFKVEVQKDIYPYYFPNNFNLFYNSFIVPSYKYFDNVKVSMEDYNNYKQRFAGKKWNLKEETINYCVKDCISLYQIINSFKDLIFKLFKVNIFSSATLPSLSFRIYRTKYLKDKIIPILDQNIYEVLVNSYFGGHTDLYIPETNQKYTVAEILEKIKSKDTGDLEKVNSYDINSLYPTVMKNYSYPTDILFYFKGDISLLDEYKDIIFGIFKVKVNAPNEIKHPLLPFKISGRSVYPTGNWSGWYNNLELNNAKKVGYIFEFLEGFVFKTNDLFSDFVNDLYKIKENTPKSDPMYLISKLILNSLYGKFGINPHLPTYDFISAISFNETKNKEDIFIDWIQIGDYYLVGYKNYGNRKVNANVAIASAVTSFARIEMSVIKNNPYIILLYSDTDSAYIIGKLPDKLVDPKKLGAFKLEGSYLKFIGIGPKVYGALDINGNSFTKVKGFKNQLPLDKLETLLFKDSHISLNHTKWFKKLNKSTILVKMSPYDLKISENKRKVIFDNKNKFIRTENINININEDNS
jgi:uncharacterized protein YprB with RNaseH-like and TPR domain